jgi:hypothetical protein
MGNRITAGNEGLIKRYFATTAISSPTLWEHIKIIKWYQFREQFKMDDFHQKKCVQQIDNYTKSSELINVCPCRILLFDIWNLIFTYLEHSITACNQRGIYSYWPSRVLSFSHDYRMAAWDSTKAEGNMSSIFIPTIAVATSEWTRTFSWMKISLGSRTAFEFMLKALTNDTSDVVSCLMQDDKKLIEIQRWDIINENTDTLVKRFNKEYECEHDSLFGLQHKDVVHSLKNSDLINSSRCLFYIRQWSNHPIRAENGRNLCLGIFRICNIAQLADDIRILLQLFASIE